MKKSKHIFLVSYFLVLISYAKGQDPAFSQFFSSPLNINPALTANINSDWRIISNYRTQWTEAGNKSPYTTATICFDSKILQHKNQFTEEGNYAGMGAMLMYDCAGGGVAKSTYGSLNFSYNIMLKDNNTKHRLGAGFGASYCHRSLNFSGLTFEDQFTGSGFNTNLPTGETALSNMKSFISVNAGIVYSITGNSSNFDAGIAAFHINQPKQTFLNDVNQYLAMRKVAHVNFETYLNDNTVLNANAIYQLQGSAKYFSAGAALGYYSGKENNILFNGGVWYWSGYAIIPFAGISYKSFQLGLSYGVVTSSLNQAARKPGALELSLIVRGTTEASKSIPCPWK